MKKVLFSLLILISAPALLATGRKTKVTKKALTTTQLFVRAAEVGDVLTIEEMLKGTVSQDAKNDALCAASKNNTARTTDTAINPYTIIIERLLDHGAYFTTKQQQSR